MAVPLESASELIPTAVDAGPFASAALPQAIAPPPVATGAVGVGVTL